MQDPRSVAPGGMTQNFWDFSLHNISSAIGSPIYSTYMDQFGDFYMSCVCVYTSNTLREMFNVQVTHLRNLYRRIKYAFHEPKNLREYHHTVFLSVVTRYIVKMQLNTDFLLFSTEKSTE